MIIDNLFAEGIILLYYPNKHRIELLSLTKSIRIPREIIANEQNTLTIPYFFMLPGAVKAVGF